MIKLSIIIPLYNQEELIIKALDSIEKRKDIEIIVIDDCSTDNSLKILDKYIEEHDGNYVLLNNQENLGVGLTINKGLEYAEGEYIGILCSDDYYIEPLSKIIDKIDGSDLIYYNLKINNGDIWKVDENTSRCLVGATKIHRREFIGKTRRSGKRLLGDKDFYEELLLKNPTEKFTNINLYHYNYPREGSLIQLANKKGENDNENNSLS